MPKYVNPGRIVLELTPSPRNPRNSEGSFVTLKDGRILFAYSHFTGGSADHATAHIASRYSEDGGRHWGRRERMIIPSRGTQNVMSVTLLRLQDGRIALFYIRRMSWQDSRPWLCTSEDEGETWSKSTPCVPAPGYFVLNNDRVIQLKTGRLLLPVAFHRMRTAPKEKGMDFFDGRAIAFYFHSDDAGRTWKESEDWWALPERSGSGLQEPGVIERADGRVFSYCRTDMGCQYGLYSTDGGNRWSLPTPSGFRSPCSPLSIKRIPKTGDWLAVWNDHSRFFALPPAAPESWGRTPLAAAISRDEGKTWECRRLIESDPTRGYCYTAIHFPDDESVLLAYCAGDKTSVLNTLRIRKAPLSFFYAPETCSRKK